MCLVFRYGLWAKLIICPRYEEHFHPDGDDGERIIDLLRQTVPMAAKKKRNRALSAHDVADIIYNHKFKELERGFIDDDILLQHERAAKDPVKRVRRKRKRAKYGMASDK